MPEAQCGTCHKTKTITFNPKGTYLCSERCRDRYFKKQGFDKSLAAAKEYSKQEAHELTASIDAKQRQKHRMHLNSMTTDAWLDDCGLRRSRKREIAEIYAVAKRPITDREALEELHRRRQSPNDTDMNRVRPRCTEMIDSGVLTEVEMVKCPVSGRKVRRCSLTGRGRAGLSDLHASEKPSE